MIGEVSLGVLDGFRDRSVTVGVILASSTTTAQSQGINAVTSLSKSLFNNASSSLSANSPLISSPKPNNMKITCAFALLPLLASVAAAPAPARADSLVAREPLLDVHLGVGLGGHGSGCSLTQKLACKFKKCSKYQQCLNHI